MDKMLKLFRKNNRILLLLLLIILINYSIQQDKNYPNNNILLNSQKYNNNLSQKRKLSECAPLNICFDFLNFNWTFPNQTIQPEYEYKDLIIKSIYKAKYFIEDFINICTAVDNIIFNDNYFKDWNIKYWDKVLLKDNAYYYLNINNFFIFFDFSSSIKNTASSKILLVFDVPIVGLITINEHIEKSKLNEEYLTTLMIHQFIHLLGFHVPTDTFDIGIIEEEEELDENDETIFKYYLTEPSESSESSAENVINYAKKYFGCPDINKIYLDLDEDGNIHWPSRLLLGELMTEFTYPEEQILSGFTLAFLEDLGYLEITKKYTGGIMSFGKNKGCNFLNYKCNQLSTKITAANEFYLPNISPGEIISTFEPSCSSSRLSKAIHKLYSMDEPNEYEYYQYGYAGRKSTNYCPISEFDELNEDYIYTGRCSTIKTSLDANFENIIGETFSQNSFCVLSSLVPENTVNSEIRAVCYEMICSDLSLTIKIKNNYIVCPREGGQITAKNFEGYLLCPDYNLICGGTKDLCNDIFTCYNIQSEDKEELNYNYNIKTTQNSDIYNSNNPDLSFGWENDENGFCPQYCMQCIEGSTKKCIQCAPGYEYDEEQNKCFSTDLNCEEFLPTEVCNKCKTDFFLAENDNGKLICEETSTMTKYYYFQEDKNYKVKCKKIFENCLTCDETGGKCLTCLDNFGLVINELKCVETSSTLYYEEDNIYKLCSEYKPEKNCERCQINENSEYICLECKENYGLIHENEELASCELISSLPDKKYYTEDGKNYFKCENSDIDNCALCERKDECFECKSGYILENAKTLCVSKVDKDNNMYAYNPQGILMPCSSFIQDCNKCENTQKCLECKDGSGLTNNNNCISESLIEENHNYYKDEETNIYISCSIIENCITCSSSTICTSCQNGFKVNDNNICEKMNESNDDFELSTGAIIGIVIGCVGFLALIIFGGYYLYKNVFNMKNKIIEEKVQNTDKNEENKEDENKPENEEQFEENKIVVHNTKRSIHN